MSDRTNIEWCNATWNPVTGCSKVSAGCKFCYAERDFHRPYPGRDFTDARCHPERLDQPLRWKKPRRIFVNSMSDLFHEKVPYEFITRVFLNISAAQQHTFQVLTKRPERMLEIMGDMGSAVQWDNWPLRNLWLGVSVENQETADERIPLLLKTPAAVRFVSYEPALGPVDFRHIHYDRMVEIDSLSGNHGVYRPLAGRSQSRLDWIIAGGESGSHARPSHPYWFRSVREQCQASGIPFFFKQIGAWTWDGTEGGLSPTHVMCKHGYYERIGLSFHCIQDGCAKPGRIVQPILKVGTKRAGRLLDGREWNEFPRGV